MINNFLTNISRLLSWLVSYWFTSVPDAAASSDKFLKFITKLIKSHGLLFTIKHLKMYRLLITKYMAGEALKLNSDRIGLRKNGFPKRLAFLQGYIDSGNKNQIRFVLTLLGVSRSIRYDLNEPNFKVLTDPQIQDSNIIKGFMEFIPEFFRIFKIPKYMGSWLLSEAKLSTKSGPLGLATLSAWRAAYLLPEWLVNNIGVFAGIELYNYINDIRKHRIGTYIHLIFRRLGLNENKKSLRKISIVRDPEAKARIIAILDWFSQEALRGFHNHIFDILKTLPQDRTFTQDPIIKDKAETDMYHSLDLSNATDRFPINLQQKVVECLTDKDKAISWRSILTWLPFTLPKGGHIHYEIGQPMGAYSSWAVFTLTHHITVQYAAKLAGKSLPFNKYILLGDDIVIYDDRVSALYKQIINGIGADFSEMKSHTSPHTYEFAKRWFKNGIEVTGIPITGFMENLNSYIVIYRNIITQYERGFHASIAITIPDLVVSFLKNVTCTYTKVINGDSKGKKSYKLINYNDKFLKNLHNRVSSLHAIHMYLTNQNWTLLRDLFQLGFTDEVWIMPKQKDLFDRLFGVVLKQSVDGILTDNTNRLMGYTSSIFSQLGVLPYMSSSHVNPEINKPGGPQDPNGGPYLFLPDVDLMPLILGLLNKMNTTKLMLEEIQSSSNFKDIAKVCDFEDISRVSSARAQTRLIGTESRIVKRMLNNINFMANGVFADNSRAIGMRSQIAAQQILELASMVDTRNDPDRPKRGYITSAANFNVLINLDKSLLPEQLELKIRTE